MRSSDIQLREISQDMVQPSTREIIWKLLIEVFI